MMKTGRAKKALVTDKWNSKYILNGKWEEEKQRNKETNIKQRQQSENNKQINYINNDIECYGLNLQNFSIWSGRKATWSCEGQLKEMQWGWRMDRTCYNKAWLLWHCSKEKTQWKSLNPLISF